MPPLSRRDLLAGTAAAAALAALPRTAEAAADGRLLQSVAFWCFNAFGDKWDGDKTCRVAKQLGCRSVELAGPEEFATIKKHGLVCALAFNGMPGAPFVKGYNNRAYHDEVVTRTKAAIDGCADAKFPSVIAFTGFKYRDAEKPDSGVIPRDELMANTVAGLKLVAGHAEKRGVTVCLEHLNTRVTSHPMKGHPGYSGDDLDDVVAAVKAVGSPRVKLLFDVYHVQVMHGDLMSRLEQCRDVIGHVHTAGCPGRGELGDGQEVRYAAVMKKLADLGYRGFVGHEFIPTRDPLAGLTEAVAVATV